MGRWFSPHSGGPSLGAQVLAEPEPGVRGDGWGVGCCCILGTIVHMLHFLVWGGNKPPHTKRQLLICTRREPPDALCQSESVDLEHRFLSPMKNEMSKCKHC